MATSQPWGMRIGNAVRSTQESGREKVLRHHISRTKKKLKGPEARGRKSETGALLGARP